ncbi:MAG TPA: MFS transporter, partial [Solirubrobacteraceae bacterium]|nr:MFS transporter [Solirubrobacteraceae bacterium]
GLLSSSLVRSFMFLGMYGCFFMGALFLERVKGYGALDTGVAFLPMTIVVAILSSGVTAKLVGRFGPMRVLLPALACTIAGLALLTQVSAGGGYFPLMLGAFILMGVGMGSASVPLLTIAMANVPPADAGLASGIVNVSMQVAGALGVAVLGTVATDRTRTLATAGHSLPVALTGGYRLGFTVAAACALAALLVAASVLRGPRREPVPQTASAEGAA